MIEREVLLTPEARGVKREDFGPGKVGQRAFTLIQGGALCEIIIEGEKCPDRAIGTLDFDVPLVSGVELIPFCSDDHRDKAEKDINESFVSSGYGLTSFGRNGLGRE